VRNEKRYFNLTEKHTVEELSEGLFSGKYDGFVGMTSTEFMRAFPEQYKAAKKMSNLAQSWPDRAAQIRANWAKQSEPRAYTQNELVARAHWPEDVVRRVLNQDYLGTPLHGVGIGEFAKNHKAQYAQLQLAMASYGLSGRSVEEAEQRYIAATTIPKPLDIPAKTRLDDKTADTLNLPRGIELDGESHQAAINAAEQVLREAAEAAVRAKAKEILSDPAKTAEVLAETT